ncbi:MAG TPA: hypothetical protein VJT81_06630 [Burkholderiales bacterium]|nr:hypothetical protein [Burkholderiales bacterium]
MRATHSQRLEKWLGPESVAGVSRAMRGFYHPIAMHGVPGVVYAMPGGDFTGRIDAGQEMSAFDRGHDWMRRYRRACKARGNPHGRLNAYTGLSALIAAATGGKAQNIVFSKTGVASNAIGNGNDLWVASGQPAAGAAGAAAPGGTAHTSANTGALGFKNPANANTGHFVTGYATGSVIANTLLLYDRLMSVAKTMNSTSTEAVTGVPTRYQNQTAGAADYIGGNFCYPMNPTTVLAGTGHNWTVCQYTDQDGNTANSFPSIAGVSACVVQGIDLAAGSWFMPLASGDVGVKALTQMQCSAAVATGTITFVVAHPIAFFPCPVANMVCVVDGINTAFNLQNIYDSACLSLLEMPKPATTATSYSGMVTAVAE